MLRKKHCASDWATSFFFWRYTDTLYRQKKWLSWNWRKESRKVSKDNWMLICCMKLLEVLDRQWKAQYDWRPLFWCLLRFSIWWSLNCIGIQINLELGKDLILEPTMLSHNLLLLNWKSSLHVGAVCVCVCMCTTQEDSYSAMSIILLSWIAFTISIFYSSVKFHLLQALTM